jgi:hypothetical protein
VFASSMLGVPVRITGNTRISFRGSGRAQFRLQHTGTYNGEPDALAWCEVSAMSNAALADPRDAVDDKGFVRGLLVDFVDGDLDVLYRRHTADWLRVVPLDAATGEIEDDPDNFTACLKYKIRIEPIG